MERAQRDYTSHLLEVKNKISFQDTESVIKATIKESINDAF